MGRFFNMAGGKGEEARLVWRLLLLAGLNGWGSLSATEPMPGEAGAKDPQVVAEDQQFFESKIRPILVQHCYSCHGEEKKNGSLRLDSLQGMLDGGESGPAVIPGKPDESLIVSAVSYESLEMPPTGKLPDDQVSLVVEWVKRGAVWPGAGPIRDAKTREVEITDADRRWWSFVPPKSTDPPSTKQQSIAENPIDLFLQAKQEGAGLSMSPAASKRVLLRRISFDLIGLPPTAGEIREFEQESRPDAYERRVDSLLASPRHGERWGRHWLDVVRFAQTDGYERDSEKPESWRYRDYVIGSINADKPYDQFLREQLAGDELDVVTDESLIATGFGRLGVWDDEPDDKANAEFEHYDDMVSTTGQSMLGLTIGCARCHDHKFDPIPQRDYYGFVSFFRGVRQNERFDASKKDFPNLVTLSTGERALAMREGGPQPVATHVLIRGDAHTPGAPVEPHFIEVLSASKDATRAVLPTPDPQATSSGRRRVLADWLTRSDHPLTARVMVNRLWQHHFGRGIVATPSDFGKTGSLPTHPELLDWLAVSFSEDARGQLKTLHRWMVESAAYRQSSQVTQREAEKIDPANDMVWRQQLRRMDAESLRDAVLAANGELSLEMGGRGFFPKLPKEVLATQSIPGNGWGESASSQLGRRSIYMFVKRTLRVPLMEAFDTATPDQSIASRSVTTIAPQALLWMNSSFMENEALAMADRLLAMPVDDGARVRELFERSVQRSPTKEEMVRFLSLLAEETPRWEELRPMPSVDPVVERWNRFGGQWTEREDGGIEVSPDDGAKALWPTGLIVNGQIESEVMLKGEPGNAGLIFRVLRPFEGVNSLVGYYVGLSSTQVTLGRHIDDYAQIVASDRPIALNEWHHLRIELTGSRIKIWVDREESPAIDVEDGSVADAGQVGFRTYQMRAGFRNMKVTSEQGEWLGATSRESLVTPSARDGEARRRAWGDLARILFNTNEFVYVD